MSSRCTVTGDCALAAVECPSVVDGGSLRLASTSASRLGQTVTFTCPAGHQLVGAASVTCLANGQWNRPLLLLLLLSNNAILLLVMVLTEDATFKYVLTRVQQNEMSYRV